ncbi:hypothetical protein BD414DRAFT_493193 [Trametes punicea]|nr:hypothetical protein BD414DRAFT_493193 [Trametes punicea]
MSAAQKLTKKQKKALAFRERKGKGKGKAKSFDELDNDVPIEENQDFAEAEVGEEARAVEAPAGREADATQGGAQDADAVESSNKGKKRKREEGPENDSEGTKGQKSKKKRKDPKGESVDAGDEESKGDDKKNVKRRYILFVGNLKYTTTKEAVEKHFSKCDPPPTVRLMTPKPSANSKPTAKSKGFAFVEFSHKNALQQGLKLHQSELDGRKINVELTAGGGGKSQHRLEKVKQRNKELHEQRKNHLLKEKSGKRKADGEGGQGDGEVQLERPQRYSATSGVDQIPHKKRTWSVPEAGDEEGPARKRSSKKVKRRPPKSLGTGVNAIPVG